MAWLEGNPTASPEERAKALRVIMPTKALEVCGKRERREERWFAADREVPMELVAKRNEAAASARRRQGQAAIAQTAASSTGRELLLNGGLTRPKGGVSSR